MNWNAAGRLLRRIQGIQGALRRTYGGRFILNTRPDGALGAERDVAQGTAWTPGDGGALGAALTAPPIPKKWRRALRADREGHHSRVLAEIPPDELLVFDIESDPPETALRLHRRVV